MPYNEKHRIIYDVFTKFEKLCLIDDKSLIWPDKNLWTVSNLRELKKKYGDEAILGSEKTFEGKLELQLADSEPEIWGLIADLFFIFVLPSGNMKFETKYSYINWASEKAGFDLPALENEIWEPLKAGFIHTGVQYHNKFGQILFLVMYAISIKNMENRQEVLNDLTSLRDIIDDVVVDVQQIHRFAPKDMRHLILYYKFPERHEPILSSSAKDSIVNHFSEALNVPKSDDLDDTIYAIRNELEKKVGLKEQPFHFYDEEYKYQWDPTKQPIDIKQGQTISEPLSPEKRDPHENLIMHALRFSKNLILTGPPGTGKTFFAYKVARHLAKSQVGKEISERTRELSVIENLTFYEILALDLYRSEKQPLSVPEIELHSLIQARFMLRPVENPRQSIWNNLQAHTAPTSETVNVTRRIEPFLFDKDKNSCWQLTDEGRTYVDQNLKDKLQEINYGLVRERKAEDFVRNITFHQSYSYEDFIEGIRPRIGGEEAGEITYEISPGVFTEICTLAKNDPENDYVLIIDEINRGNISKIFGELITLIEDDKREKTCVTLPYSKRSFYVPKNLYIIGTMNTADRSIALMDVALRRRFTFIELMPRIDLLNESIVSTPEITLNLGVLLEKLNNFITQEIDRYHQIGHSYLMPISNAEPEKKLPTLSFVWNHQILPLLEEYFYSQHEKLISFLSPFLEEDQEDTLSNMLREGDDLLFALSAICGRDDYQE
jgi:5-methylcytosine-specific restriction endonuclease McrBC GTP-binding regulatory subunit McrB